MPHPISTQNWWDIQNCKRIAHLQRPQGGVLTACTTRGGVSKSDLGGPQWTRDPRESACMLIKKCTSKGIWRRVIVLKRGNSLQKSLCPVVLCPYLRSSELRPLFPFSPLRTTITTTIITTFLYYHYYYYYYYHYCYYHSSFRRERNPTCRKSRHTSDVGTLSLLLLLLLWLLLWLLVLITIIMIIISIIITCYCRAGRVLATHTHKHFC